MSSPIPKNNLSIFDYVKNFVAALLLLISFSVSAQEIRNEESIKKILTSRSDSLNPIEGIWEVSISHEIYHSDTLVTVKQESEHPKIGIVKEGEKFHTFNLATDSLFIDFIITDVNSVYL